jgi:hypothetical protein
MSDFFKNGIVQGVLLALVGVLVLGLFGWLKFRRDEKIVAEFLENSGVEAAHTATTTHAIHLSTKLSKARIGTVCRRSKRIKRHREEGESWKLSG